MLFQISWNATTWNREFLWFAASFCCYCEQTRTSTKINRNCGWFLMTVSQFNFIYLTTCAKQIGRIRENPAAIISDIKGMLLRIAMKHEDKFALRFLLPNQEIFCQCQLKRPIFRANCSPFCAICTDDKNINFLKLYTAIKNLFYIEDLIPLHLKNKQLKLFNKRKTACRMVFCTCLIRAWRSNI